MREAGAKKGLFVDPFRDDAMRDAGIPQTAAIVGGELTLPLVETGAGYVSDDIAAPACLPYTQVAVLEQPARTGSMKVNPYQAFAPIPATVKLLPAVDRWTDVQDTFGEPVTKRFTTGTGDQVTTTTSTQTVLASTVSTQAETLRPLTVAFEIDGFHASEPLLSAFIDGISATVTAN